MEDSKEPSEPAPEPERRTLASLIGVVKPGRSTAQTVEDVRALRDEWD